MPGHRVEEAAVRAAGAQRRRAGHGGDADIDRPGLLAKDALLQKLRIQLIELASQALALTGDAGSADLGFHKIVELLDDVELLDLLCERTDEVHRQRIRQAELQEGRVGREGVLRIFIGNGGGDDADLRAVQLHPVQRGRAAVGLKSLERLFQLRMVQEGVCRGGDVLARIAGIGLGLLLLTLAECHDTLGVRHARRGAEEHGNVELLGNAVGLTHEVQAFLRIGRLDHGQLRCAGIVAVILLVLGGVHAGIVCGDNDEAAADAVVGSRENGVCRNVDTDMLHRTEAAYTCEARAVGHFRRDLFVRRPLTVKRITILGQRLEYLRAGGTGISGTDFYAGFIGAARNGFVAGEQNSIQCDYHLSAKCFYAIRTN